MQRSLTPSLDDVRLECVLMQAWKKTSAYLRTHSWYADTLGIDYQSLRIPDFIAEVQEDIDDFEAWLPLPLELVPAPKSQRWKFDHDQWKPVGNISDKLRPLAHVALRDQVVATAILLCLADRMESQMGDPRLSIEREENRRRVLAYGHRLFCDATNDGLRHRWGSSKLYRSYFADYQTFLERPRVVAEQAASASEDCEIAIVQSDISKFYDRVTPETLHRQIAKFRQDGDDKRFFRLAKSVLDWKWADGPTAERHAAKHDLPDFTAVALPQGLASAGFFANAAMQQFESALRASFANPINDSDQIVLLDACYYVDDFRFVLRVPDGFEEGQISNDVTTWLQGLLEATCPGLIVQREKTKATVQGRDRRFLVPQSRAAKRIQNEVSGVFDMQHGTELIGSIEGFFHTQQRYSSESTPENDGRSGLLVGMSDMQDQTAARFAAGRFRRTFRSLRPMLSDDSVGDRTDMDAEVDEDGEDRHSAATPRQLVLSKAQLDDRGRLFAALLIEEWTVNPANVRLLRIALDIYPDVEFLDQVLRILKRGWTVGGSQGAQRQVQQYCLAELFRAGATETGIVYDSECLPSAVNADEYHRRLVKEAIGIFDLFVSSPTTSTRLPWYLMQQVFLYLAARDSFPEDLDALGKKGGPHLALYRRFAHFLAGDRVASLDERTSYLVIAKSGFGLDEAVSRTAKNAVSPEFLEKVDGVSPSTAAELWDTVKESATPSLRQSAERLGLSPKGSSRDETRLPDLTSSELNPFVDEINLLYLAQWLFTLDAQTFDKVVSPWQIACDLKDDRQEFGRIDSTSLQLHKSPQIATSLFEPPDWCESRLQRRRYQIGILLRFAIRGNTALYSGAQPRGHLPKRYRCPISHWEQQRYSGFQGRSAFGPPWIPLSSFVEDLLFELLRWPGSGITKPMAPIGTLASKVKRRLRELKARYGTASGTSVQDADAPPPYPVKGNWERPLRIGVVQSVTPCMEDYEVWLSDPELRHLSFRRKHKAHIAAVLESVAQLLRVRETHRPQGRSDGQLLDLLVFPELAIHQDDIRPLLLPFVRVHKCIVLFGMVYHREPTLPGNPLLNSCQWLIPNWSTYTGLSVATIEQGKRYLAREEKAFEDAGLKGFRPAQWRIAYRWHSDKQRNRPLYISASVCYDATDLALARDLECKNDLYIVCALNQDVGAFDRMSDAINYHMYQGVLVVNNGQFGGSSFYMPLQKPYHRQIFHQHGQPQVSIAFAEISPKKLISRPGGNEDDLPRGKWKTPPAGWISPES